VTLNLTDFGLITATNQVYMVAALQTARMPSSS
jgi:hypothetical protein